MRYSDSATNGTALRVIVQSTRWAFPSTSRSKRSPVKPSKRSHTSALMDPSPGPGSELPSLALLFSAKLCWPEGCFLNKSRGTVTFADKGPRRNKSNKISARSSCQYVEGRGDGKGGGRTQAAHCKNWFYTTRQKHGSFYSCFPFYDSSSAWPNTVQQGRLETWNITYLPLLLAIIFSCICRMLRGKETI